MTPSTHDAARSRSAGFTLIELMIVVAIIAIIASVAMPRMNAARLSANESAAIAAMRSLMSAQAQFQSSSAVDTDGDGAGEYGCFAELAGIAPLRITNAGLPAAGTPGVDELNPPILSAPFGMVNNSQTARSGYIFQIWLPDASRGPVTEDLNGGFAAAFPDPDNCEYMWSCYAWPIQAGQTGNRVFFVNHCTEVLQNLNRSAIPYSGITGGPPGDAANMSVGDISSPIGLGGASVDGQVWTPVQ